MKLNLCILNDYVERGLITRRSHPTKPLYIYNYTAECSYSKEWDEVTLLCRGLIVTHDGTIKGRPFKKFFNFGELEEHKKYLNEVPKYICSKMDGSLGILFYTDIWEIATRGSFESDQAIEANKMLVNYDLNYLGKEKTYLLEIIYEQNQIVVKYDKSDYGLWMLGAINTETGEEEDTLQSFITALEVGFKTPNLIDDVLTTNKFVDKIKTDDVSNEEGFVLTYNDGTKVKLKYSKYVALHKILSGLTEHKVWESLMNKTEHELLEMLPDEHYEWAENIIQTLNQQFDDVVFYVETTWILIKAMNLTTRKDYAEQILKTKYPGLIFNKLDGAEYKWKIWKIIEPKQII